MSFCERSDRLHRVCTSCYSKATVVDVLAWNLSTYYTSFDLTDAGENSHTSLQNVRKHFANPCVFDFAHTCRMCI